MSIFPDIPGYQIEKWLGQGRLADVYLASREEVAQNVIIKKLLPELAQEEKFGRRFLYEIKKATELQHPNIARVLDSGEYLHHFYLVNEFFLGSLRDRLAGSNAAHHQVLDIQADLAEAENTPPPTIDLLETLEILKQLIDALDYAHQEDIVHRDIRPDNIFFRDDKTPVIVDFQISKLVRASSVLKHKGVPSTPFHYACPEQFLKQSLDSSSDFYSLGITLYEMLTGQLPYQAKDPQELKDLHLTAPIPQFPDHLSLFQPLLDRMMAKTQEERVKSGEELFILIEELSNALPLASIPAQHPQEKYTVEHDPLSELGGPGAAVPGAAPAAGAPGQPPGSKGRVITNVNELIELTKTSRISSIGDSEGSKTDKKKQKFDSLEQLKAKKAAASNIMKGVFDEDAEEEQGKSFLDSSYTQQTPLNQILEKVRNPKIFIPAAAVIVIAILLIIFLKPSGGSPQGKEAESLQEKQILFDYKFKLAKKSFKEGKYSNALKQVKEAEGMMNSPELQALKQQVEEKNAEQEDKQAFQRAVKLNSINALEKYLTKYPNGLHVSDAQIKLQELDVLEKKQMEKERQMAALRKKLRASPQSLTVEEAKSLLQKWGFFEKYYNKTGSFKNNFEQRTIDGQGVIYDFATGLMWVREGTPTDMNLKRSLKWLEDFNQTKYAGFSDWRIPTLEEAMSLLKNTESQYSLFIDALFYRDQTHIWTCDTGDNKTIWVVDFYSGDISRINANSQAFVRPVRSLYQD